VVARPPGPGHLTDDQKDYVKDYLDSLSGTDLDMTAAVNTIESDLGLGD
jgi:hypothetical protein